jgi:hypothetical protein
MMISSKRLHCTAHCRTFGDYTIRSLPISFFHHITTARQWHQSSLGNMRAYIHTYNFIVLTVLVVNNNRLYNWFANLFNGKKGKILFLGLDNAGKTTLLHLLKTGNIKSCIPTLFAQNEEVTVANVTINAFDIGMSHYETIPQHSPLHCIAFVTVTNRWPCIRAYRMEDIFC